MNFTRNHTQNRTQDLRTETYLLGANYVFHDQFGWQSIDTISKVTRLSTRRLRNQCFIATGENPFSFSAWRPGRYPPSFLSNGYRRLVWRAQSGRVFKLIISCWSLSASSPHTFSGVMVYNKHGYIFTFTFVTCVEGESG